MGWPSKLPNRIQKNRSDTFYQCRERGASCIEENSNMSKIDTIRDSGGEVYTGRVVGGGPSNTDVLGAVLSAGLSIPFTDIDKVTVRVNGQNHTGHRIRR